MIELNEVSKTYGKKRVVGPITLTIEKGQIVGLIGPNGAGKSTLLHMLGTLLTPSTGSISVEGKEISEDVKEIRRSLGFVPQEIALYSGLTAKDNVNFFARIAHRPVPKEWVSRLIEMAGLTKHMTKKVKHLSGGMQRKLNIIVALLNDPDWLLMDEPTVGIDIQSKQEIVSFIRQLGNEGKTIIYSSHDPWEIETLCDRLLVLNEGRAVFYGTKEEALKQARERFPGLTETPSFSDLLGMIGMWR
ncbi:ABC transporter ATP-binding protein [Fictibacillus sp. Mic-4]|uniref:ABC transporter ATP-binding protein n=1 Tax=Fictibacillus sp. Mic-4 TaxID=3132826 RepID=UPI003CF12E40